MHMWPKLGVHLDPLGLVFDTAASLTHITCAPSEEAFNKERMK